MKILIDGRVLAHKDITGIQRHAIELSRELLRYSYIDLATPKYKNRYYQQLWEHTLLPWYARKYDLLFSPSNVAPFWLFRDTKLVVTIHDLAFLDFKENYSRLFQKYYQLLIPFLIKKADKVLTISNFSKERIIKEYPKVSSKIDVIYHGLSKDFKDSLEKKEDYILYVGAINEIKNFQTVLELFMSDELCDIPLKMILANSDSFKQSDKVRELLLDSKRFKNIEIIDKVSQEKLIKYYQKAKIFLFPSFHESFGFPPLEAMACKTPVIVSDTTALPEICKDAALYIDPNDKDDIKEKLLKLYSDDKLQKDFIKRGFLRVDEFNWEKSAKKHLEIFEEVVSI